MKEADTELWSEFAIGAPTVEEADDTKDSDNRIYSKQELPQVGAATISVSPNAEHRDDVSNKLKSPYSRIR